MVGGGAAQCTDSPCIMVGGGQNRPHRGGDISANFKGGGGLAKGITNGGAFQAEETGSAKAASGMTDGWAGHRGPCKLVKIWLLV